MTSDENILAQLDRLRRQGSIPRSQCGGAFLRMVRPLVDSSVLSEEKAGAGRRLVIREVAAFDVFVRQHFPHRDTPDDSTSRAVGVARFRDSKAFASDTPEIVTVRAWDHGSLMRNGKAVGAAAATGEHGVFAFVPKPNYLFTLHGRCALVENPAVFHQFEQLNLDIPLVIYGHGRISSRLLDWLAATPAPDFSLLHLPDYDPVGLSEYQRLRDRLGDRVQLHVPLDLEDRFQRYSNRDLFAAPKNRDLLAKLRRSSVPVVRQVVTLMDRHNAGLEQESLLIGARGVGLTREHAAK